MTRPASRFTARANAALLALLLSVSVSVSSGAGVVLKVGETPDPATLPLASDASVVPSNEAVWLVFGRLTGFDFAVENPENLRILDGAGNVLPLTVETNTIFREFDEIIALTLAFELDPRTLAKGNPRAEWGADVQGTIQDVAVISFPEHATNRLHTFTPDDGGAPAADPTQFATIEIIADSQADKYYLWYLLPMVVIFVLLIIRKRWTF